MHEEIISNASVVSKDKHAVSEETGHIDKHDVVPLGGAGEACNQDHDGPGGKTFIHEVGGAILGDSLPRTEHSHNGDDERVEEPLHMAAYFVHIVNHRDERENDEGKHKVKHCVLTLEHDYPEHEGDGDARDCEVHEAVNQALTVLALELHKFHFRESEQIL